MRLWTLQFGKGNEAVDYSGRKIIKGAYNDRNSKHGWNIDHILPKSQGGKNEEKNLIICHIKTNDEKANSFPVFNANGKAFQIIKKGSLWVIEAVKKQTTQASSKQAMAMNIWKMLFEDAVTVVDFAGREIFKDHYRRDGSIYAWDIAPAVEAKPLDYDNVVLAHMDSLDDKDGKTAFSTNDKRFAVKKLGQGYRVMRTDGIDDAFEPVNLKQYFSSLDISSTVFANYIFIKVSRGNESHPFVLHSMPKRTASPPDRAFYGLVKTLEELLNTFDIKFSKETLKTHGIIAFKAQTQTKDTVEEVKDAAILLNTYRQLLMHEFSLSQFVIINALFESDKLAYEVEIAEAQNTYGFEILGRIDFTNHFAVIPVMGRPQMQSGLYINDLVRKNIKKPPNQDRWAGYGLTELNLIFTELNKKLYK